MTCKWGEKKNMTVLLAVGLFLLIGGLICNLFLPEEAHLPSRIAGFFSGMGGSFTASSLVVLVVADHRRSARQGQQNWPPQMSADS